MKTTTITRLTNLFTPEELDTIKSLYIEASSRSNLSEEEAQYPYEELGRFHIEGVFLPEHIQKKLEGLVNLERPEPLESLEMLNPPLYVEYNAKYGQPNLQPHVDGDFTDFIIDFQLESNTAWPLGLNEEVYPLEDNEALLFNPNTNIHWRPRKDFQPGEYVKMIFFRFFSKTNKSDYSHLPHNPADPMFASVHKFRDSLPND